MPKTVPAIPLNASAPVAVNVELIYRSNAKPLDENVSVGGVLSIITVA